MDHWRKKYQNGEEVVHFHTLPPNGKKCRAKRSRKSKKSKERGDDTSGDSSGSSEDFDPDSESESNSEEEEEGDVGHGFEAEEEVPYELRSGDEAGGEEAKRKKMKSRHPLKKNKKASGELLKEFSHP